MRASKAARAHMHPLMASASHETQESDTKSKNGDGSYIQARVDVTAVLDMCHMPFKLMQAKPYVLYTETAKFCLT